MEGFINTILDIMVYGLTGALASWFYYHRRRRDLLGGFWGGALIGVFGSVIITWLAGTGFIQVVNWLMNPKKIWGGIALRVNLIAAILGAFFFVYILNRINHNRERRE